MVFVLRLTTILCLSCLLNLPLVQTGQTATRNSPQSSVIKPEQVRQYLENYLEQQGSRFPQAQLRFRKLRLPKAFTVPEGRLSCQITPSDPGLLASSRFNMIFRVNGKAVENIAISATLEALAPVAIASGDLRRGTLLKAEHIRLEQRDLCRLRDPSFEIEELLGQRLKRSLRKGAVLERSAVNFPPVIKRGEIVTITARKGSLLITAKGMAQQNGDAGDLIRVRNINSLKDLLCRVTGPVAVSVEL